MTSSSSSRRMTRSQTTSVLGKRPGGTLSRSPSVASMKSSSALLTPDTTPDAKKPRTSIGEGEDDPSANKENIPPLKDIVMETPVARRLTRRATTAGDFVSPSPTRARRVPRRNVTLITAVPQTPTTSLSQLTLQTPPPTPPSMLPLHVRARACLRATSNAGHVAMSSEGRTKEMEHIRAFLVRDLAEDDEEENSKSILYISGSPGTGKTALVNTILSSLETSSAHEVKKVFLNCMTYQGVDAVWDRLYEEILGSVKRSKRASSSKQKTSKDSVIEFIERNRDFKCVFILDEMDHLSSISPLALRPLFNLATQYPTSVRIMGIANTHTLTSSSSSLPFDVTSSQNIETIHFQPYQPSELLAILTKRLESLPQDELKKMLPQPALILLTKKVASQTGDVRVLFEVLRGAIELAAHTSATTSPSTETPITSSSQSVVVTPAHILAALKSYTPSSTNSKAKGKALDNTTAVASANSEIVGKIVGLGLQQRLALLSLLLATKRLTSNLPLAASAASTPASSPTKRSPAKRAQSFSSVTLDTTAEFGGDASAGVDVNVLFAFYAHILQTADTFNALSRSEFADLLGVLETTGLLSIQSTSSGRASFKRSSSFTGRASMASGASSAQSVRLQSDVREAEVARGMGLDGGASGGPQSAEGIANVMQEEVRAIWMRELTRIRKEKEALVRRAKTEGVDVFDDAMEA